jgi:hypothetical protein
MNYVLVRHKVADFSKKWKPVYDAYLPARQKAGLKEEHLLHNGFGTQERPDPRLQPAPGSA